MLQKGEDVFSPKVIKQLKLNAQINFHQTGMNLTATLQSDSIPSINSKANFLPTINSPRIPITENESQSPESPSLLSPSFNSGPPDVASPASADGTPTNGRKTSFTIKASKFRPRGSMMVGNFNALQKMYPQPNSSRVRPKTSQVQPLVAASGKILKALPVEAKAPSLLNEYKYRKSILASTSLREERRDSLRLSQFASIGSNGLRKSITNSPAVSNSKTRGRLSPNLGALHPHLRGLNSTPLSRFQQMAASSAPSSSNNTSESSDIDSNMPSSRLKARRILKRGLYATYFIGILFCFKNQVTIYGALRPIEYFKEFEKNKLTKKKTRLLLPILPTSNFSLIWAMNLILFLALTAILTPVYISFVHGEDKFFHLLNWLIDITFGLDIIINFLTAYYDSNNILVTDLKKIAIHYLKTWFWVDIVAVFPYGEIIKAVMSAGGSADRVFWVLRLLRFPRVYKIPKLLRLVKMSKFFTSTHGIAKAITKKFRLNFVVTRIFKILVSFAFLNHLVGCLWFYVAQLDDFAPETWVSRNNLVDKEAQAQYVASLYWSFQTLTTVGYGDIAPQTTLERVVSTVWMLIGVGVYSFIVGNLSALLFAFDKRSESLKDLLASFGDFATKTNLPSFLDQNIRRFFEINHKENVYYWADPSNMMKYLPANLKKSVLIFSYYNLIKNIKFLQVNSNLTAALIVHLKLLKLKPEEILYREDDRSEEIYFIVKGSVKFMTQTGKPIFSLSEGTYFGEFEILDEEKRKSFCQASEATILMICHKDAFLKALKEFPDVEEQFQKIGMIRKAKFEEKMSEIQTKEMLQKKLHINVPQNVLLKRTEFIQLLVMEAAENKRREMGFHTSGKVIRQDSYGLLSQCTENNQDSQESGRPQADTKKRAGLKKNVRIGFEVTPVKFALTEEDADSSKNNDNDNENDKNRDKDKDKNLEKDKELTEKLSKPLSIAKRESEIKLLSSDGEKGPETIHSQRQTPTSTFRMFPVGETSDKICSSNSKLREPESLFYEPKERSEPLLEQIDCGMTSLTSLLSPKTTTINLKNLDGEETKTSGQTGFVIESRKDCKSRTENLSAKKTFFFGQNLLALTRQRSNTRTLSLSNRIVPLDELLEEEK